MVIFGELQLQCGIKVDCVLGVHTRGPGTPEILVPELLDFVFESHNLYLVVFDDLGVLLSKLLALILHLLVVVYGLQNLFLTFQFNNVGILLSTEFIGRSELFVKP